jgi:hypothetical protein
MATFIGKISDTGEINYVRNIIRASGATDKQFVRAALLAYCGMLLEKATQLKESSNAGAGNAEGDIATVTSETSDSNVLADSGNTVADTGTV